MEKLPKLSESQLKAIECSLKKIKPDELLDGGGNYASDLPKYEMIREPLELQQIREEVGMPIHGAINADLSPWETSMTNPEKHQDAGFRYLVHAVHADGISRSLQNIFLLEQALAGKQIDLSARIDLLQTPERIAEKPTISCSLIDEAHRATWAPGGYVLKVPADNVLKTCAEDTGNLFCGGEELVAKLYKERDSMGVGLPEQILQMTFPYDYNEVVVAGMGRTGKKVKIVGVFEMVLQGVGLVDTELANTLSAIASVNGWPIVQIQKPFLPYKDSVPSFDKTYFGFNLDGKRYIFWREYENFSVLEYGGEISRPMAPKERAFALDIVKQHLAKNQNKELEALVAAAEKVPDSKLLEKIQKQNEFREAERGQDRFKQYKLI